MILYFIVLYNFESLFMSMLSTKTKKDYYNDDVMKTFKQLLLAKAKKCAAVF